MSSSPYVKKHNIGQHPIFPNIKPVLSHLTIELTERCNNSCIHCYINQLSNDKEIESRELSLFEWKNIISQAAELGTLTVRITGGEPLLSKDFIELYLYIRKLGMKVMLFTNARLITPELADLFAKVPPLLKIEVSSYGMHSESYDRVACAKGAFSEFSRGINLLLERNIPFIVKSVLLPPNKSEIDEFEDWSSRIPFMEKKPSYAVFLDLRTRRDSPAKNRVIESLRFSPEDTINLLSRDQATYMKSMAQFSKSFMFPQGESLFLCDAGTSGCVDAYGNYQMCTMLRHPDTVHKLRSGSLREAHESFFPEIRKLKAKNPEYLLRCARCFLKGLCEQCPAKSWAEHGTLDTPVEYFCEIAHAQAQYLGLLKPDEKSWEIDNWRERILKLIQPAD